jgi:multidrug efflux system outer membrane protein
MKRTMLSVAVAFALTGCANLAPDFMRPAAPIPGEWPSSSAKVGAGKALAEIGWQEFFVDQRLRGLVELALRNNRDLRVAVLNIEKARAQYRISDADRFPAVNATGASTGQRTAEDLSQTGQAQVAHQHTLGVGFSAYELDFFGRVRNLSEQALEQFLATGEAKRSTQISLVAEVANAWLTLAADQERLQLARETLASQRDSLGLAQRTFDAGMSTALDLNQARMSVEAARVDVARYTTSVAQDRNALALLAGTTPPDDLLPTKLAAQLTEVTTAMTDVPAGVPSETLLQRPDIIQAERLLRAANANIGAARAAFYPRITLTASGGVASNHLSSLFDSGNGTWLFMPQIVLPIFNAGSNQANLDAANADQKIRVAEYEKTIQSAFREASDALAVRATIDEQMAAQQAFVDAAQESYRLSDMRYTKGIDSYLPVLDSQRSFYSAQQNLIGVRLARQSNVITLYKVFGGGWQEVPEAQKTAAQ